MQKTTALASGARSGGGPIAWLRVALELRYFAVFTVIATYGLIVLGGTVRSTDSGTACPDWPLCHGQVIPPFETKVMIEYSHRVVASVVGLLILATVFWAWRRRREDRLVAPVAIAIVVLLAAQVIVGGVTVNTETEATVVAVHLSLALSLLAGLIYIAAGAWTQAHSTTRRLPLAPTLAALSVLALMLTGAYVSQEHAGLVYPDWPLFDGRLTSAGGKLADLHYAHRLTAAFAGVMVGAAVWRVLRGEASVALIAGVAAALVLYVAQVFVGAANIWLELPTALRVLHLALASALWGVLVFTVVWSFLRGVPSADKAAA